VTLGGRPLLLEQGSSSHTAVARWTIAEAIDHPRLTLRPHSGGGALYYTLTSRSLRALAADDLQPISNGMTLHRVYLDGAGNPFKGSVPAGSVVQVMLMLHNPSKATYVALDDVLPAGLEPIDPNLAITGRKHHRVALPYGVRDGAWAFNHVELHDDRVTMFADLLEPGVYRLMYRARATTLGEFVAPAARVHPMYQPDVYGRTATSVMEIR
ncbi:MAG: hypothetical protein AAFS10_17005, partial [Myxococcota bacterium]